MAAPVREITIVGNIIAYLRGLPNCWAEKTHGEKFGAQTLDITGCYQGIRLEFEVKRPGGKPTDLQRETMRKWRKTGAIVACVHSVAETDMVMRHGSPEDL